MKKITDFIVEKRNFILVLFVVFLMLSAFLSKQVKINYDMTKYLPKKLVLILILCLKI